MVMRYYNTDIDQIFLDDDQVPTGSFDEIRNDNRQRNSFLFNIGSDFYIDEKNTLTTSLLFSTSNKNYGSELFIDDYQPINNLIKSSIRDADDNTDETYLEAFVNYTSKFNKEGHEISVSLNYDNNIADNNTYITNSETFPGSEISNQKYEKNESVDNYYFQLDYILPINESAKLEAGHKSSFRIYKNDFAASNLNPITVQFENIPQFTSVISYDESVYAFYVNYSQEFEKLSYTFGLRTEISKIKISEKNTNQIFSNNYNDLFPSAIIGYNFNNKSSISATYSKYIDRPAISELNPFNSFTDERFILVGNPFLKIGRASCRERV